MIVDMLLEHINVLWSTAALLHCLACLKDSLEVRDAMILDFLSTVWRQLVYASCQMPACCSQVQIYKSMTA